MKRSEKITTAMILPVLMVVSISALALLMAGVLYVIAVEAAAPFTPHNALAAILAGVGTLAVMGQMAFAMVTWAVSRVTVVYPNATNQFPVILHGSWETPLLLPEKTESHTGD